MNDLKKMLEKRLSEFEVEFKTQDNAYTQLYYQGRIDEIRCILADIAMLQLPERN